MDEQNSKKDTSKKDKSTRPLNDPTGSIQQAKAEGHSCHRNDGESKHRSRGPSWYKVFAWVVTSAIGFATLIVIFGQWQGDQVDTIATRRKERARVALSNPRMEPDPDLSFSLIFKNVGETPALNTYGARLGGECPRTSSQECVEWCLQPLRETQGKIYGPLLPQDEHKEEFFHTLKTGKARKKQRPVYFCGYFAYTDVFCMWRRQFYVLSYDSNTDLLSTHSLGNDEEEARAQNCSQ